MIEIAVLSVLALLVLCFVLFTLYQVIVVLNFVHDDSGLFIALLAVIGFSIVNPLLLILSYPLLWICWYAAREDT